MVTLLSSGKINIRLLCEISANENFQRPMMNIGIMVDQIAHKQIAQINLVLVDIRQKAICNHIPERVTFMSSQKIRKVQENDFFSNTLHDVLEGMPHDIRRIRITTTS